MNQTPMMQRQQHRLADHNVHRPDSRWPSSVKHTSGQSISKPYRLYEKGYAYLATTKSPRLQPNFEIRMDPRLITPPDQTQFPSTDLEKTFEDVDWDTLFSSVDSETQAVGVHTSLPNALMEENSVELDTLVNDEIKCPSGHCLPAQEIDFIFQDGNVFQKSPSAFEEGMEIVRSGGKLSLAALAFESACQTNPMHFEAWRMLGCVLSECEREPAAIQAFKEALKLEPKNIDIMMRLAVSYTNEGTYNLAFQCLEEWLRMKYPQIPIPEIDSQTAVPSRSQLLDRIKEPFIQAARLSMAEENVDPDVQIGLGVLMFSTELYQMAADCFFAAIESTVPGTINYQSQLHLLWNRYGACLGNIRQNESAAIQAYEMALAIKPNYVKARYNLGVLYYNMNEPLMGVRNILEALLVYRNPTAEERTGGLEEMACKNEETSIYEVLRRCCYSLRRWDLAESVGPGMDVQMFKAKLDI